jgi:hypothetical protein
MLLEKASSIAPNKVSPVTATQRLLNHRTVIPLYCRREFADFVFALKGYVEQPCRSVRQDFRKLFVHLQIGNLFQGQRM